MKKLPRVSSKPFIPVILTLLLFASIPLIGAPKNDAPAQANPADLVMIVDAKTPGQNKVTIVFSKVWNRPDAEAALGKLLAETGWQATNITYSDSGLDESGKNAMTSIDFASPQTILPGTQGLPIESIINAFKDLNTLQVVFSVPQGFVSHGIGDIENRYVKIHLSPGVGSYQYTVTIKDKNFTKVDLSTSTPKESAGESEKYNKLRIAFVVVLALLAAMFGYIISSRFSHKNMGNR